jgi:Putative MetA-pathway of phenol degradation
MRRVQRYCLSRPCGAVTLALTLISSGIITLAFAQDSASGKQDGGAKQSAKSTEKPADKKQDSKKQDAKSPDASQGGDKPKAKQDNGDAADKQEDLINPDRPGLANGSQVIGPRHFQIETGIEQDTLGGGSSKARLLSIPTLLRFGIDNRYEIRIETNGYSDLSQTDTLTGTTHANGIGPVSIGFKRQFQTSKGPGHPSIGTIVRFFPASGSSAFATNHATYDALLCADWDFAPKLSLNPNIGFGVYEDGNGILYGNFQLRSTLTYAPTSRFGVFVDFGLQTPESAGGRDSLIYDTGVTYILGTNLQLDVSVGTGALGRTSPHPFLAGGVSVRF